MNDQKGLETENLAGKDSTVLEYYGATSKIEGLTLTTYPKEYPMFFLCTSEEKRKYNQLIIACLAKGFEPNIRKLCFTLKCAEGLTHQEIRDVVQGLPIIDKAEYDLLVSIPHWNPVKTAIDVLEKYMELAEAQTIINEDPKVQKMLQEAIDKIYTADMDSPDSFNI